MSFPLPITPCYHTSRFRAARVTRHEDDWGRVGCPSVFWGNLETNSVPRARDPLDRVACELGTQGQIGQKQGVNLKPKNNMAASGVVKVLVSFYRSGEDSAFERHRSRVTFDLVKQSIVATGKKRLTEFLGP